jgi:hypothetical protein
MKAALALAALLALANPALAANGNNWYGAAPPNYYAGTPADPTQTASASLVMMGLGGAAKITPVASGVVLVTICGDSLNTTINDGVQSQIVVGLGTAPANGAAVTGTAISGVVTTSGMAASAFTPLCQVGLATGLTLGSQYWIDAALATNFGGTAFLAKLTITAYELP